MTKNEYEQRVLKSSDYKLQETIDGAAFDGTPYKIFIYPNNAYLKFDKQPARDVIGTVKSFGGKWNGRFKSWVLSLTSLQDLVFNINN